MSVLIDSCLLLPIRHSLVLFLFIDPYLTFGVGGYQPPSAEAITVLAHCASPNQLQAV